MQNTSCRSSFSKQIAGMKMTEKLCTIENCAKKCIAKGYCAMHYRRNKRHGDPYFVAPKGVRIGTEIQKCSVEGCEKKHLAKGFCKPHYFQQRPNVYVQKITPSNPHEICKKLGKPGNPRFEQFPFKCRSCEVSYSKEQQKMFENKFQCPCCHKTLRTQPTKTMYKKNVRRID